MSDRAKSEDFPQEIVFDGENIAEWFRFDRQVLRRAKKLYGRYGDKLWNGTTVPIDQDTVNSVAQDAYDVILKNDGIREANSNWEWDWFWTEQYQKSWRSDALESIVLYVESRCKGKAFKFITELTEDQWRNLRNMPRSAERAECPRNWRAKRTAEGRGRPRKAVEGRGRPREAAEGRGRLR